MMTVRSGHGRSKFGANISKFGEKLVANCSYVHVINDFNVLVG